MSRLIALIVVFAACAPAEDSGELFVRFLSDRSIPDQAESLEVVVFGADSGDELARRTFDFAPIERFPATLEIVSGEQTPSEVRIEGRIVTRGVVVAAGAASATFRPGDRQELDITLVGVSVTRTSMPMGRFGLSTPPWPDRSPAERDFDVAEYKALGVEYLRLDWISSFDWQVVAEQLVDKWLANGFQVVLVVGATTYASRMTTAVFETFCRDAATRFTGKVGVFEVMNEPDLNGWTPETYVPYLQACYRGIKAGDQNAIVSTGGVFSFERHIYQDPTKDGMAAWMRRMYQAGAKGYFDAAALQLYSDPADHSGGNSITGTWWNTWDQAFLNSENVRGVMDAYGDENTPIWSSADGEANRTEADQAMILARQSQIVRDLTYPIASRTVYTLRSDSVTVGIDSDGSGLLRLDLSRKPAWFAYRDNKQ